MACNNCYNGCSETVSDKCVKYTGLDVPALGIENGDSLASVEQAIFNFLVPVLNGSGVKPIIDDQYICEIIQSYLPTCTQCDGFTLNEILTAIIRTACKLKENVDSIFATLTVLNSNYSIGCLTGVSPSSDTHDVLQATINKLCQVNQDVVNLSAYVNANLLTPTDVNNIITAYINTNAYFINLRNKMIPYTVVPFYPTPSVMTNFDPTGAGTGTWDRIFLCNGLNGTPDLRGRVLVGATTGMSGGPLNPDVTPGGFNPNYALGTTAGSNSVTLNLSQIPTHSHTATSAVSPNPHSHALAPNTNINFGSGSNVGQSATATTATTGSAVSGTISSVDLTVDTTVNPSGSGQAHANNQPATGIYYIMYIP